MPLNIKEVEGTSGGREKLKVKRAVGIGKSKAYMKTAKRRTRLEKRALLGWGIARSKTLQKVESFVINIKTIKPIKRVWMQCNKQ